VEYIGKEFSFKSRQFQKILQGGHHWPTLSKNTMEYGKNLWCVQTLKKTN
jgi:hypothetical protein